MKILHTGDIHLDSPFSSLKSGQGEAKELLRRVFSDIIKYCENEKIDMLLIAGDLFDLSFATRETAALIKNELEKVKIPVVISPGNHDPYTEKSIWAKKDFSSNVHIFEASELSYLDFDELGVRVYGYAFTSAGLRKCPFSNKSVEDKLKINILLAHADTASPLSAYCPTSPLEIKAFGADYAALGHIHSPEQANAALVEKEVSALYCGAPQGRDFGECGEKGAILIEITKDGAAAKVNTSFVSFARRIYADITLDVTGCDNLSDLKSEIRSKIKEGEYGEENALRIHLAGNISPEIIIDEDELENALSEGLYSLTLKDETTPLLLADELSLDRSIRGEVYRVLSETIESSEGAEKEAALAALRYALSSLAGEDIK